MIPFLSACLSPTPLSTHSLQLCPPCSPLRPLQRHFHDWIPRPGQADIFADLHPSTVALSVVVLVEMFNALNNLSDTQSLLVTTIFSNLWSAGRQGGPLRP